MEIKFYFLHARKSAKNIMSLFYNNNLKKYARELRNNMTKAENALWKKIKNDQMGVKFYRQKIILNYIVDFYCHEKKLVIELDGDPHYLDGQKKDELRDDHFKRLGLEILRFTNLEVLKDMEMVIKKIWIKIENK